MQDLGDIIFSDVHFKLSWMLDTFDDKNQTKSDK